MPWLVNLLLKKKTQEEEEEHGIETEILIVLQERPGMALVTVVGQGKHRMVK